MSSDDLPQKCQEQVCAILFAIFFFPVSRSRAGALTQTEIIAPLWSECLFLLDTPTLPHFFKELKLKVSKCVFLSLKINDWCVLQESKNRSCSDGTSRFKDYTGVFACFRSLKYKSHLYYYCCQIFSKEVVVCKVPTFQTASGLTSHMFHIKINLKRII